VAREPAAAVAAACGYPNAVTFDMGGTSTECVSSRRHPRSGTAANGRRLPCAPAPALDIHTIGAGGGSLAVIDRGGALTVDRRAPAPSRDRSPTGRGGTEPTVADADLVLGRIPPNAVFGELGPLDVDAARAAFYRNGIEPPVWSRLSTRPWRGQCAR